MPGGRLREVLHAAVSGQQSAGGVCSHWRPGAEKLCPAALQRLRPGYLVWLAEEGSECPQGHWGVTKRDGEAVRQEI